MVFEDLSTEERAKRHCFFFPYVQREPTLKSTERTGCKQNNFRSKFLTFKLKASCYFFLLFVFSFFVGNDQWLYGTFHRHPVIPFVNLQIWKYSKAFLIISIYEPSMFRILKGFINVKPRVFIARIKFSFYIRFFSGLF